MHLFKYFNRVCVCEIDALLANILGQDKTAWMFWNWVKAEEFSAFGSSSGFLESSLRLCCPCFYGLIKRAKSWEVCRGKHLRLRCAPRSVPWPGRGACTLKSGPGTRWTISSCQSGSSQFKGSSRQRLPGFIWKFTAAIKWLQAEKHCENLFTSQQRRPCWPWVLQVIYGGLLGYVCQARNDSMFLSSSPLFLVWLLTTAVIWDESCCPLNLEEGEWRNGVCVLLFRINPEKGSM